MAFPDARWITAGSGLFYNVYSSAPAHTLLPYQNRFSGGHNTQHQHQRDVSAKPCYHSNLLKISLKISSENRQLNDIVIVVDFFNFIHENV